MPPILGVVVVGSDVERPGGILLWAHEREGHSSLRINQSAVLPNSNRTVPLIQFQQWTSTPLGSPGMDLLCLVRHCEHLTTQQWS
jgi:hypothetical protein